jgi:hypothetical protein
MGGVPFFDERWLAWRERGIIMATCQDGGNGSKLRGIDNKESRTQLDALRDVIHRLKEARVDAEKLNDELLLYLIDMAIRCASDMLTDQLDNWTPAASIPE